MALHFAQILVIFACTAHPVAPPPEQSDEAPNHQSIELNLDDCMRIEMQVVNKDDPTAEINFGGPSWMRAAAEIAAEWETKHPGWYVYRMKGPRADGTLPPECLPEIKCPRTQRDI
jgi:hypothetical protein